GVREHLQLGSRVGFLALHGGLERGTFEIAAAAGLRSGASLYAVVQPADLRWHLPSSAYDPAHSDALAAFLEHVDIVVSVHGYGGLVTSEDRWTTVLVGGSGREIASRLAISLRSALPDYTFIDDLALIPERLRGVHPANPVNRARGGGVQLELPPRVRGYGRYWDERAHEHDTAPSGLRPHTEALVGALADQSRWLVSL
ncbi:MAG: poly-gamma-glutamate hydrolase family protein, partial [Actinomycetota bacterium]